MRARWEALARGARTTIVAALAAAALFAVLELGARAVKPSGHVEVERALATDALKAQSDARGVLEEVYGGGLVHRFEPFAHYRLQPFRGAFVNIDPEGWRATPSPPTREGAPEVWIFGGSTTWGMGARDDETIPAHLARRLAPDLRVRGFGQIGYQSTQELVALLGELRAGGRPATVVFLDGVNEVLPALLMNRVGVPLDTPRREVEFNLTRPEDLPRLLREAARGLVASSALITALRATPPGSAPVTSRVAPEDEARAAAAIAHGYLANRAAARGLARERGFRILHLWQPTVFSKRRLSAGEAKIAAEHTAWRSLFERARAEVSARAGDDPDFVDLGDAFGDDDAPVFFDFCHLSERGNARLAEVIADLLARAPPSSPE